MTKTELNEKIEALKKEYALKDEVQNNLKGLKTLCYMSGDEATICVDLTDMKDPFVIDATLQQILEGYPTTEKTTEIKGASKTFGTHYGGVKFTIQNNVRDSNVLLTYKSPKAAMRIKVPCNFYHDMGTFNRGIYETEYHYFTGVGRDRLSKMEVKAYSCGLFRKTGFYGGDIVIWNDDETMTKVFETYAFTGVYCGS